MKLTIVKKPVYREPEIEIRCSEVDRQLQDIIDLALDRAAEIPVQKDGGTIKLPLSEIYYLESVDEKTFVYGSKEVYRSAMKLYEAESLLSGTSLIRISKSCIMNIDVLSSVRVLMNGKMEALLDNGERLIINRHYVPDFKKKFGL